MARSVTLLRVITSRNEENPTFCYFAIQIKSFLKVGKPRKAVKWKKRENRNVFDRHASLLPITDVHHGKLILNVNES